ncbi:transposase [Halomonas daqiaonensis]|uniref:transposase n=1 Tax=Halomonas daqiaonensis TaxID=650850 RepID=UPI0011142DFA
MFCQAADFLSGGNLVQCTAPLKKSVLEGMNNRIKAIKWKAYGHRDRAYFFLKIRATIPRKVR